MGFLRSGAGLMPHFPSPAESPGIVDVITEEAAVQAPTGQKLPVTPLVSEGEPVAKGAPVACLRQTPSICLVAPIAGRVARVALLPGRRLSEIVLFRDVDGGTEVHDTTQAETAEGLRRLMQTSGVWPWLRRRPFGGMPAPDEVPAAIFVMAADTHPYAPSPVDALAGREDAFGRGLEALRRMTEGPVFLCLPYGAKDIPGGAAGRSVRQIICGRRHPQGCAGVRIHQAFPASLDAPVWDIHAEDVAELGEILNTGVLPMRRVVRVGGAALREGQVIRTHPGADLRQLTQRLVVPGPHVLLSGSQLDGRASQWLGQRHRQVTVMPREAPRGRSHWLIAALTKTAEAKPAIPTAALNQALAAAVPAAPFIRALGAGDEEAAMRLGVLSFLEEDLALADYALSAEGEVIHQLRTMLDSIQTEYAA